MKKIIIYILFIKALLIASDVHPAYLYSDRNKCVDYFYYTTSGRLYYKYSHEDSERSTTSKKELFIPGYEYNTTSKKCYIPQNIQALAMDPSQYHMLIGLVGVLVGFTFFFFMIQIFVFTARK